MILPFMSCIDSQTNSLFSDKIEIMKLPQFPQTHALIRYLSQGWRGCSLAVLTCVLLYWTQGGWLSFLLLILVLVGVVYQIQDNLLYYPEEPETSRLFVMRPTTYKLPFEDLSIPTRDGLLINAYFIPQPAPLSSQMHTVVLFHGNAGNIGHRLANAHGLYTQVKCNVLLVEYRGYGRSQGYPSEQGLYLDSQAAMDYLIERRDIDSQKIVLFGRSLGGAVAIDLACNPQYRSNVAGVIVENTFTSIMDIGANLFAPLQYAPSFLFKNKFQSLTKIETVQTPFLFLSGLSDTLVAPSMMNTLYHLSPSEHKFMKQFPNGTHNTTWQCPGYYQAVSSFLMELSQLRKQHMGQI